MITQWRDAPKYKIHQKWITQHKGNCYHKMAVEHYECQRVNESLGRHCRKSDYFNVYINQYPKMKTTMGSASQHPLDVNGEARDGGTGSFKHRLAEIWFGSSNELAGSLSGKTSQWMNSLSVWAFFLCSLLIFSAWKQKKSDVVQQTITQVPTNTHTHFSLQVSATTRISQERPCVVLTERCYI